jgi:hypothetical protein
MKNAKKTILFLAGASGNFLSAFLPTRFIDQNRLCTIDNLPTDIDQPVDFLVDNSKKYSIFK